MSMSHANVLTLSIRDFTATTLQRPGLWLVDFTATWCAPCRVLEPVLADLAGRLAGQVGFARVDVDDEVELAARFGVTSMPTMLLFRDGAVVGQRVGALPRAKVLAWLDDAGGLGAAQAQGG